MNAPFIRDVNFIPPSQREFIAPWSEIRTLTGKTFQAAKAPNWWSSKLWRVLYDGEMYLADAVELDMLWETKTPAELGLDPEEIVNA